MITRRTKIQLIVFVVITLVGVTFVGARYARLDRIFYDDTYTVTAHFADSGGIFERAEVTYRGVTIGRVGELKLTEAGVDVHLDIEKEWDAIPSDVIALVGNRSAVGEQYVELQPKVDGGPYLKERSEIAQRDTRLPLPTATLLEDISNTVSSVDEKDLQITVSELGKAFDDTGKDLAQIIDTANAFIETADENFDVTTALIRDANTVLSGQLAKASAIQTFSKNLALFSTTLAGADTDLRSVIDTGSATVNQLRTFITENEIDLSSLLNNVVTVSQTIVPNLDGVEHLLTIYPHVVEAGFTVIDKDPDTGNFDAHFGLILTPHALCHEGYGEVDRRNPFDTENRPLKTDLGCTDSAKKSNARGAQNLRRAPVGTETQVVAEYDRASGEVTWLENPTTTLVTPDTLTTRTTGEESWKWLLLRPLLITE